MRTRLWIAAFLVGSVRIVGAEPAGPAGVPVIDDEPTCLNFGRGPDLAICTAEGLIPSTDGRLASIACILDVINKWEHDQLACLESRIQDRASTVIYPIQQVLRPVGMALGGVNTLRDEVERLACGWRFSTRTRVLQEMYLKPVRLCRPSIQVVFGRHDDFWNASLHELADWTSVVSKNVISSRTGDKGDLGPESTWRATAMSVAGAHVENMRSPAEALRLASTVAADTLRVQNSTMDMRAQRLLAGELLRSHKAAKNARDGALAAYFVDSVAALGRRCGPDGCASDQEDR